MMNVQRSGGGNGRGVKGFELYNARRLTRNTFRISRRGAEVTLGRGAVFYIRSATSNDGYRIVLADYGATKVFSVSTEKGWAMINDSEAV